LFYFFSDQNEDVKKIQQEVLREVMNIAQDGMDSISNGKLTTFLLVGILAIFIFSPLAYAPSYSSVFNILRPLGKILYLFRFLCAMFLTGLLFYVIFNGRDERKAYQNVQHEIKLQMKYRKT
jgi:sensor histidine kinase YesM